jgi:hypothetical protein
VSDRLELSVATREVLRGRAVGIAVLAYFALAWTGWGMSKGVPTFVAMPVIAVAISCSLILMAGAVLTYRWASHVPSYAVQTTDRGQQIRMRFGFIVAAEFVGLAVAAWVAATAGKPQVIAVIVCLGVGIHFFPLRRLFAVPLYDRTGAALCLIAVTTFVVAPLTGVPALWTMLPGFGAALTLYTTCVLLLRGSARGIHDAARSGRSRQVSR